MKTMQFMYVDIDKVINYTVTKKTCWFCQKDCVSFVSICEMCNYEKKKRREEKKKK